MTTLSTRAARSQATPTFRYTGALHAESVDNDGVFLLAESGGALRLGGDLISKMHPLLQRGATREQIVEATGAAPETVARTLAGLTRRGAITSAPSDNDHRFWEHRITQTVSPPKDPVATLANTTVVVHSSSAEWEEPLHQALTEAGFGDVKLLPWTVPDPGSITLYVVDDYQDTRLDAVNRAAVVSGARWYPVKPAGGSGWFGPLFGSHTEMTAADRNACLQCLIVRLDANRLVRNYLVQRNGSITPTPPSSTLSSQLGVRIAAQHLATLTTATAVSPMAEPAIITFDYLTLTTTEHRLQQRPQCAVCGTPDLQAELQRRPVTLERRPKLGDGDGGDRAVSAHDLVQRFSPYISPITGLVKQLTAIPSSEGLHAYQSGQNFAIAMTAVEHLRSGLRSAAAGKGKTDIQARASAIGEAIERSSGRYFGDEARVNARSEDLDGEPILPNDIALYSQRQFAERDAWNSRQIAFQSVCDPFNPAEAIDWTPVWSLSAEKTRYAPTANLFYGYPYRPGHRYGSADSNGCAAGASIEDAILQGFFELVERDSVAIWWYNRLRRPAVDLTTFNNSYFSTWTEKYRAALRDTWILDLTFDLGIPCVVAISRRRDKRHEDILMAFGAHFDIETAISRAMTEMNQFLPAVIGSITDDDGYAYNAPDQVQWWRNATLDSEPYLVPEGPVQTRSHYKTLEPTTLDQDVYQARGSVEAAGLELLVLNQTRPDAGLPVVRVLVPGMRHFWTRFAPGRLYDVPVQLGLRRDPITEDELNPIGMFL